MPKNQVIGNKMNHKMFNGFIILFFIFVISVYVYVIKKINYSFAVNHLLISNEDSLSSTSVPDVTISE